jgi:hypothetical protein
MIRGDEVHKQQYIFNNPKKTNHPGFKPAPVVRGRFICFSFRGYSQTAGSKDLIEADDVINSNDGLSATPANAIILSKMYC